MSYYFADGNITVEVFQEFASLYRIAMITL